MKGNCEILYSGKISDIRRALKRYKDGEESVFISTFIKGNMPKQVRYTRTVYDATSDLQKTALTFDKALEDTINELIFIKPTLKPLYTNLLNLVRTRLHIELDESLVGTTIESNEGTTITEVRDINVTNLREHFKDIYGTGSENITRSIRLEFKDDMTTTAYINGNELVPKNDIILNRKILVLKNKYYNRIVKYLQLVGLGQNLKEYMFEDGKFIGSEYFHTLQTFYQYIKTYPVRYSINKQSLTKKELMYQNTIRNLLQNPKFFEEISLLYKDLNLVDFLNLLYDADLFSSHYYTFKDVISRLNLGNISIGNRTIDDIIEDIESLETSSYNASSAYTKLTHFDEMLSSEFGKSFSIEEGLSGIELGTLNKYKHHQDTSHEKKGWLQSESIDSEKYTAELAKAVFEQIRVYDHKTGTYKNRRTNSVELIVAARNLINDIVYNNIEWNNIPEDFANSDLFQFITNAVVAHQDPVGRLLKMLEYLFKNNGYKNIRKKLNLKQYDLDILYSVYKAVYDRSNPNSLLSLEHKAQFSNSGLKVNLSEEISGYIDRNTNIDWVETTYDLETNSIKLKIKKKFENSIDLLNLKRRINSKVNSKSLDKAKELKTKYQFLEYSLDKVTYYTINIGNEVVSLKANNSGDRILGKYLKFENLDIFDRISNVDLDLFKEKILLNSILDEDELVLKDLLQFIDDHIDIGFLSNPAFNLSALSTYITILSESLQPLVKLAMLAAYVNSKYANANGLKLSEFLKNDELYRSFKETKGSTLFTEKYENVKYNLTNTGYLNDWIDAVSVLTGRAAKSTTKDAFDNNVPNNSVNKLGAILYYYLEKQKDTNSGSLMFVQDRSLIKSTLHDLEILKYLGEFTKSVSDFSEGELCYHTIFDKFFHNFVDRGTFLIQPTCYSDKTTFINYEIEGKNLIKLNTSEIVDKYIETIGEAYKNIWKDTLVKLNKIAAHYNLQNNTLHNYKKVMSLLTEQELIRMALEVGVNLEKDKDYRIYRNKIVVNEQLEYNAEVLYKNPENLSEHLEKLKKLFIQHLVDADSYFQVIDYDDSIETYFKEEFEQKSNNPIINTVLKYFGKNHNLRKEFFKNWVDPSTGKLILAKLGKKSIIRSGHDVNPGFKIEVNPLLDKFFYLEGLLSNNLRMSLTGSEINHPNKAYTLFDEIKDADNEEKLDTLRKKGIDKKVISEIQKFNSIDELIPYSEGMSSLGRVFNESILDIINTAQGTLFKRNVIIPATLLYCQQNLKDGIPPTIKCAVIYDTKAPVFNYRGDHDKPIDSCDGVALIDPFLSILENKSLGSQAVGFTKKPIWHGFKSHSMTAFLAKFATNTITNETMQMALGSKTNLYNLFKKMTNLQWLGDVNLLQVIGLNLESEIEFNHWFKTIILGLFQYADEKGKLQYTNDNRLLYKNQYDDIVEILGFGLENGIYYTKETKYLRVIGENFLKKYHIFYDTNEETSKHIAFNTLEEAQSFLNTELEGITNKHTTNSLFELHSMFGGIECVNSKGELSEFSNEVVCNLMNNIGYLNPGYTTNDLVNLVSYTQPLKKYHIGYALNNTAVKNGAENINPASSWSDNTNLTYFEVDSDGLGMQMNADHDIINSELTEFSQVVTATSAYGYTHELCKELFQGLALAAMQSSELALAATNSFLTSYFSGEDLVTAQSELYDSIGRIIMVNRQIKNKENLLSVIMEAVTKVFYKSKDHSLDSSKIPFSDPNIYSDFIATLASTINKQSIKRKHPGTGAVLVASYNMALYFELNGKKVLAPEIIKKAKLEYYQELVDKLIKLPLYNPDRRSVVINNSEYFLNNSNILKLEELLTVLGIENDSTYYNNYSDLLDVNKHYLQEYLNKRLNEAHVFSDTSWFMPTDVVDIVYPDGTIQQGVELNSLGEYYKFKDTVYPEGTLFRVNVISPRNLRPSLIRWHYEDGTYMNIFDSKVIKDAFFGIKSPTYRDDILKVLHNLSNGFFIDENGVRRQILDLENEPAELILSNIYKEQFRIGLESLNEVLEQGEKYFYKKYNKLNLPINTEYDLAFLKDSGHHTMISLSSEAPSKYMLEYLYNPELLCTNENGTIFLTHKGRTLFEVGLWVDDSSIVYNGNLFVDNYGNAVPNQSEYRLGDVNNPNSVLKRVDYITRYTIRDKMTNSNKQIVWKTGIIYKINPKIDDFKKSELINSIYLSDNFKIASINTFKTHSKDNIEAINKSLTHFYNTVNVSRDVKDLIVAQINSVEYSDNIDDNIALKDIRTKNKTSYKLLLELFLRNEAHKRYISFVDSQNFISARIPALTLLSFMAMKNIAWTQNSKNMAYVSHFLFYLQGSDLDIDKAYIMGQSYDDSGIYIGWSNLFDYSSVETLQASKLLPIPKGITITKNINGVSIDNEVNTILTSLNRAEIIRTYARILRKAEDNNGLVNYTNDTFNLQILNDHEQYIIPQNIAEKAYKNVASANIYAVSHDIKNRDQAYTAISMALLQKASRNTPKGNKSGELNMFNPLTKYKMLYQNLVGKDVISVAANGEKFWFNMYYYWHEVLKSGKDINYLKFNQDFKRVEGRAEDDLRFKTVAHIPDLNIYDQKVRIALESLFGATSESLEYKYVDQLISLLLSAATDNAKELILAKINSGTNLARMHVYLMTMGFNINDIVSFMTSPVAEFVDKLSASNIFQSENSLNRPISAIELLEGKVNNTNFLHGSITLSGIDSEGNKKSVTQSKYSYVLSKLKSSKVYKELGIEANSLDSTMLQIINSMVDNVEYLDFDLTSLISIKDLEINNYLQYCLQLVELIRNISRKYKSLKEYDDEVSEFKRIYENASEMSTIASKWLGLNQGLPTDKFSLLKRLNDMSKLVYDREKVLGITKNSLKTESEKEILVLKLLNNNPTLENVSERLDAALDIVKEFDIIEYLRNPEYRKKAIDYYDLIKGSINGLHMMEILPNYKVILDCLNTLVTADYFLASKSRLIDKISNLEGEYLTDQKLKGIINYVDNINIVNFVKTLPIINSDVDGFNVYFLDVKLNLIDLSEISGIATFRKWAETNFYDNLKSNYASNGFVKHLIKIPNGDSVILATDIDLLNPDVTTVSLESYEEILQGMAELEKSIYLQNYTCADILLLYNLVVNKNKYGGERLTTAFKVCESPTNILNQYLRFISDLDYNILEEVEYDNIDYLINSAVFTSPYGERFHKEMFIKVTDPVQGFKLKIKGDNNTYRDFDLIPSISLEVHEDRLKRLENYHTYCPVEMPHTHNILYLIKNIDFDGEFDLLVNKQEILENASNILKSLSLSGKLQMIKDCYAL